MLPGNHRVSSDLLLRCRHDRSRIPTGNHLLGDRPKRVTGLHHVRGVLRQHLPDPGGTGGGEGTPPGSAPGQGEGDQNHGRHEQKKDRLASCRCADVGLRPEQAALRANSWLLWKPRLSARRERLRGGSGSRYLS